MKDKKEIRKYARGQNPNSKRNLQPVKKGEVRNPNGKPPGTQDRSTILREIVGLIADFQNPITKANEKMPVEKRMEFAIVGKAMKGDVQAYREIKDTLYGKIADKNEHSGPDGKPIETKSVDTDLSKLSTADLLKLREIQEKLNAA